MTRNSASKKHKIIQGVLKEVLSNLSPPPGWILQHVYTEYVYPTAGKEYKIDVHAQWRKIPDKYELMIEIQKNMAEKEFSEKVKHFTMLNKRDSKRIFNVIEEDNVPDDAMEMWDYLEEQIQVPW